MMTQTPMYIFLSVKIEWKEEEEEREQKEHLHLSGTKVRRSKTNILLSPHNIHQNLVLHSIQ